jgi:DNA-binding NtrC family response regulator
MATNLLNAGEVRVLVADDDFDHNRRLAQMLEAGGQIVQTAGDADDAIELLTEFVPDVILTSVPLGSAAKAPAILVTALGSADRAAATVEESGGFWFLEKPVSTEALRVLLARAAQHGRVLGENARLRSQLVSRSLPISVGMSIDEAERVLLEATLTELGNNKTHAARALGISAKTLHQKLRQYRLQDAPHSSHVERRRNAEA